MHAAGRPKRVHGLVARVILALAELRSDVLALMGEAAESISPAPSSVIVFGSFARAEADADSDIDLVVVRPDAIDEDGADWVESLEAWRQRVRVIAGNDVEVIEASASEVSRKLRGRSELWRQIKKDAIVVFGAKIDALTEPAADHPARS